MRGMGVTGTGCGEAVARRNSNVRKPQLPFCWALQESPRVSVAHWSKERPEDLCQGGTVWDAAQG